MAKQAVKVAKTDKTSKAVVAKAKPRKKKVSEPLTDRHQLIAHEAFLIAEQRGFQGGDPVADWLQAEAMIDINASVSH